jgi:hypothetical protein
MLAERLLTKYRETDYDAFEALCDLLFPEGEDGQMFFWKARFDASGKHSDLLVVAGYLANQHKWKAFNQAWKKPLTRNGRTDIFHATDFESGQRAFTEENGWPESRINEARVQLIDALLGARLDFAVACCVKIKDYEESAPKHHRDIGLGSAYQFAVSACMTESAKWCQFHDQADPVSYVVEHGEGKEGALQNAFQRAFAVETTRKFFRLGALAFDTKEGAVGLQAADMLANYMWAWKSGSRSPIEPYTRITHAPNLVWEYFDKAAIGKQKQIDLVGRSVATPELSFSIKPPTIVDVEVSADFSEAESLVGDIEALAKKFPQEVYTLIKHSPTVEKLFSVEAKNESTLLANSLRVSFKPNERALSAIAAIGASQPDGNLGKGKVSHEE